MVLKKDTSRRFLNKVILSGADISFLLLLHVVTVVCTWKAEVRWMLTLACVHRFPWFPVRLQTEVSVTV